MTAASPLPAQDARGRTLYSEVLPSQLVRYESTPTTTPTTVAPPTPTTITTTTTAPASSPVVEEASARVTETPETTATPATTPPPPVVPAATNSEQGQATWYAEAPPGMCASPTLPFGTVLTVTTVATGASTTCTVDDREEAGYPRVVDMSPSGFAQLADPSQGVVDVTISW